MRNGAGPVSRTFGALGRGVAAVWLGIVHIANGNPQPVLGDATNLQGAGGAVGYVTSSLLLDLMQTPYVVVPLLGLLATFGILIITATPVEKTDSMVSARSALADGASRQGASRSRLKGTRQAAAQSMVPAAVTGAERWWKRRP